MGLVSKIEFAQRGMNRSFILMLVKAKHTGIDIDGMVDVIGDSENSFLTDLIFSVQ